jgi:hypothetical protein
MLYHRLITRLWWLVESPEGQSRKKDECSPNAVVPSCLVNIRLHIFRIYFAKVQKYFVTLQTETK